MNFLSKLNTYIDIDNDMLIIWLVHDKDFINGSYYKFDIQNRQVYFCVLKNIEYYETIIATF